MLRGQLGNTLCEFMVVTLIMSYISAAFLAVMVINFKTNAKITNADETIGAVSLIKQRLGNDIRHARGVGDVFGIMTTDPGDTSETQIFAGSSSFPSSLNPVYGAAQAPPNGWPSTFSSTPWTLSNQCLVVQVPILDNHNDSGTTHNVATNAPGWPTMIQQGQGSPAALTNNVNVETHVYMMVADPDNPGGNGLPKEWLMYYYSVPGMAVSGSSTSPTGLNYSFNYLPAAHNSTPQILLTGIIGPLDSNGNPKVFQYIDKTSTTGQPEDTIPSAGELVANINGVIVNLEIRKHDETSLSRTDISLTPVGFKLEMFMRNNAMSTPLGQFN